MLASIFHHWYVELKKVEATNIIVSGQKAVKSKMMA